MGGLLFPILLVGAGAAAAYAYFSDRDKTEARGRQQARREGARAVLNAQDKAKADLVLGVILDLADRKRPSIQNMILATAYATTLGIPKTVSAIRNNSALPFDENWPGTSTPVKQYVAAAYQARKQRKG